MLFLFKSVNVIIPSFRGFTLPFFSSSLLPFHVDSSLWLIFRVILHPAHCSSTEHYFYPINFFMLRLEQLVALLAAGCLINFV